MFWLRNRQRQYGQAQAEAGPDLVADRVAVLDAAGRSMRHAGH